MRTSALIASLALLAPVLPVPSAPGAPTVPPCPSSDVTAPNVLVILIDDCGPDQLECYDATPPGSILTAGSNQYHTVSNTYDYAPTPNITKLAERGVRFTRAFSSPTCSPARAQLNTGRYPQNTGIGTIVTPNGITGKRPYRLQQTDLPTSEIVLGEALALTDDSTSPDYTSIWIGKWHLTREPSGREGVAPAAGSPLGDAHPVLSGWPEYEGIIRNPREFPRPDEAADYKAWLQVDSFATGSSPFVSSSRYAVQGPYITTYQREDLQAWIEAQAGPWCAVWAATACHSPYTDPPTALQSFGALDNSASKWTRYRAALEALDTEIGNLETNLGATVWDNTIVILAGDNGTEKHMVRDAIKDGLATTTDYIAPYADTSSDVNDIFKGSPYMTGTNIPLIVAGDCVDEPGRTDDNLVDIVDIFDSIMELTERPAGWESSINSTDGISFVPSLETAGATNGRAASLALTYRPNGPMVARDGFYVGYTHKVGTRLYRLVRKKDAGKPIQPDEFYLISDGGVDVDPLETTPLPTSGADYVTVRDALALACPECD